MSDMSDFWLELYADKTISSGGFTLEISADGDDCLSQPCMNGATCFDLIRDYSCQCDAGYEGKSCDIDTNECRSDPCQNGGTCIDGTNIYTCTCHPSYTGDRCQTGRVIVSSTSPSVPATQYVSEGSSSQSLTFDLAVTPSSMAAYSVGGTGTSNLWSIEVYLSPTSSGNSMTGDIKTITTLSQQQQSNLWNPPDTMTFSQVPANDITVPADVTCSSMQYLCARFGRGANPSPNFEFNGDPNSGALLGCTIISCRGVVMVATSYAITSGQLLEGVDAQIVSFDMSLDSSADAGSVTGSSLWNMVAFASSNSLGTGTRLLQYPVTLNPTQGSVGIQAGVQSVIRDLSFEVSLANGAATCSDIPYICVEVSKGASASPDFTLTGDSGVFVSCQQIVCRGVEITSSQMSISSGDITEGNDQSLVFDFSMESDANAGSVRGTSLWQLSVFLSTAQSASSAVFNLSSPTLSQDQGSTAVAAGVQSTINSVTAQLNLASGPTCSEFEYVCVKIAKGSSPTPDFRFMGVPSDAALLACQQITCRGVEITSTNPSITGGEFLEGTSATIAFSIGMMSSSAGGSLTGTNLWNVTAFLSSDANGGGQRVLSTTAGLSTLAANAQVTAGQGTALVNMSAGFSLSDTVTCSDFEYFCVEVAKSVNANPAFTLTGVPDDSALIGCTTATCGGVEITDTQLAINSGNLLEGTSSNGISFDFTLISNPNAGSVSGSNLWDVSSWLSANSRGEGTRYLQQTVSMNSQQAATPIVQGVSTASISGLSVDFDTTGGLLCSQVTYMCVSVDKGTAANPDFELNGTPDMQVFTSCEPISCRGIEITGTSLAIQSGQILEGASQTVNFEFSINSDSSAGSVSGSSLWDMNIFLSDSLAGTSRINEQTVSLTASQSGMAITAGTLTTISGLSANLNLQSGPTCSEFSYVCVELSKSQGANPDFGLTGSPDDSVFTICESVTCTGVTISGTSLDIMSGDIKEGTTQMVTFDLSMDAVTPGGSVRGSDLWQVTTFGSLNPNGAGRRVDEQTIPLSMDQGSTGITAGSTATLSGLTFEWDLSDGPRCAEFDYFCATLEKSTGSSVDFELQGTPSDNVLTSCQPVTCRGVEITSTLLDVLSGDILEGTEQNVGFGIILQSNSMGGSVTGDDLWQITAFLSTNGDGSGTRLEESRLVLTQDQAGTDITAGNPSDITGLTFPLYLDVGSTTCSDFSYVCVEITQGSIPTPSFLLDSSPQNLTDCFPISCRGVQITDSALSVTSNVIREGIANNLVTFDVTLSSRSTGGSLSGNDLWNFTVYGSSNQDGTGNRVLMQEVSLGALADTSLTAGVDTAFGDITVPLSVTGDVTCADVAYICLEISKGALASPDFTLSAVNTDSLSDCQPLTCQGVEITSTSLGATTGLPLVEGSASHQFTFDLNIDSNALGGNLDGIDLWSVRAYASDSVTPGGAKINPVGVTLSASQASTGITAGSTATIPSVNAQLDLSGNLCSDLGAVCVELSKNSAADPDFTLVAPADVLTSCVAASCTGVEVSGINFNLASGGPLQAGSSSNDLVMNVNVNSNPGGASLSGSSLWQVELFVNDQSDGSGTTTFSRFTNIPPSSNSQTLTAGTTLTLSDLSTSLDLYGQSCADIPYMCVRLSKSPSATPDFTLSETSADALVTCQLIPCQETDECNSNPCQNGAMCTDGINSYSCACPAGYSGTNCQIDINECNSDPCQNGGTCADMVNRFQCTCAPGFTGILCNNEINECGSNPCENGGTCENLIAEYRCRCPAGYTGTNCQTDIDECNSAPCRNGGTCNDLVNLYSCNCADGWAGADCSINVNECASFPCKNGGTCDDDINGFTCTCTPGWTGAKCDIDINECLSRPCINGQCTSGIDFYFCTCDAGWTDTNCGTDIDECSSNPCFNDGTCTDMVNGYMCSCAPGWTGDNCQTDILECASSPCMNGGSCNDLVNEFTCDCVPGYVGVRCQTDFDECASSPCENEGTCTDDVNGYTCTCANGYTGDHCEIEVNECTSQPCQNGGTCNDMDNRYTCTCAPGWTGVTCTEDINECASNPCRNGGTCSHGTNVYFCACPPGWRGYNCETDREECNSNPCQNGGSCLEDLNGYSCGCVPGYTGTHCEKDINECASSPCVNGATCLNQINQYDCRCAPGYYGENCQFDTNECNSSPCLNGGSCNDRIDLYVCSCAPGWTGTNCNMDIDECTSAPCENGGSCINGNNTYTCTCTAGYTGINCETEIDECSSSPCLNGATCMNNIAQYICTCRAGFTGIHCQIEINECDSSPCLNGGICIDNINSYTCTCADGYGDTNCQTNINECASSPCLNGGTCIDEVNGYQCLCPSGREGVRCELDTNECASAPCLNGGSCSNLDNAFSCTCVSGYTGNTCNEEINECSSNPCRNGATCSHTIDFFQCQCPPGYEGLLCETNVNECASNPCLNGGTCNDRVNSYECQCTSGWSGATCNININECTSTPCINGYCVDQVNGYMCVCNAGWTGVDCGTNIDECGSSPCENGGTCDDGVNKYTCRCTSGWTGYNCNEDVNECSSNPCRNGARCNNLMNGYNCTCAPGWTGTDCDVDINECDAVPCMNGGTCLNLQNQYICQCTSAWTGTNCDIPVDECMSNPCQNGGTCNDQENRYTCTCAGGWTGVHCEMQIFECSSNPCVHGVCSDELNGYRCICDAGWTSEICNINIDDCATNMCMNEGTCVDLVNDFRCNCPPGWTGTTCNIDINECASSPCQNGGTCADLLNKFTCTCPTGFTGIYCEIDINECNSDPCRNGGLCYNNPNGISYRCACRPGYTGDNCEIEILECESDPCLNGGTCIEGINSYTCQCAPGYAGVTCLINVNDCSNHPCQNNGVCIDEVDAYTCVCQQGYSGPNCEIDADECLSDPCLNGAMCFNRIGQHGYDCQCPLGFTGVHCEINIDDCAQSSCLNGGICRDGVNSYTCVCPQGWSGVNCEISVGCRVNYTLGVGEKVIINSPNYPSNYGHGENCIWFITGINGRRVDVDFKDFITENRYDVLKLGVGSDPSVGSEQLGNTGSGPIMPADMSLQANALWLTFQTDNEKSERGFSIEFRDEAYQVITPCDARPCINGGMCMNTGTTQFTCQCTGSWEGTNCELPSEFNKCGLNPCKNGAECMNAGLDYTCSCPAGYTGKNCTEEINECDSSPCQNGGRCIDLINGFVCVCQSCYTGRYCQIAPTESTCTTNVCENSGTCAFVNGEYNCTCDTGYQGNYCEIDADKCRLSPCGFGTCSTVNNEFLCTCDEGFIGDRCDIPVTSDCVYADPCQNGGTCSVNNGSYVCECPDGMSGQFCEEDIDDCSPGACGRNGVCQDKINGFECLCRSGYSGASCQTDVDECASSPCQNGGICIDKPNGFLCTCAGNFIQPICTVATLNTVPNKAYTFQGTEIGLNPYFILLIVALGMFAIFFFLLFLIANVLGKQRSDRYDTENARKGDYPSAHRGDMSILAQAEPPAGRRENDYGFVPPTNSGAVNDMNSYENPWPASNDELQKTPL